MPFTRCDCFRTVECDSSQDRPQVSSLLLFSGGMSSFIEPHWASDVASPSVISSRTQVREVSMLVHHGELLKSWLGMASRPAAATVLAGAEPTVLNGEESGKVGKELVQRGRKLVGLYGVNPREEEAVTIGLPGPTVGLD